MTQAQINQEYLDALDGVRFWINCIDNRDPRDEVSEILRWANEANTCLMEAIGFASVRGA